MCLSREMRFVLSAGQPSDWPIPGADASPREPLHQCLLSPFLSFACLWGILWRDTLANSIFVSRLCIRLALNICPAPRYTRWTIEHPLECAATGPRRLVPSRRAKCTRFSNHFSPAPHKDHQLSVFRCTESSKLQLSIFSRIIDK